MAPLHSYNCLLYTSATVFSLNEKYTVKEIMFLVVGIAGVAMALCGVVMMAYGIRLNNKKQRAYLRLMAEREENIKQKEIPIQELKEQLEPVSYTHLSNPLPDFWQSLTHFSCQINRLL